MRLLSAALATALLLFSWAQSYAKIHDGRALEADPFLATEPIAPKLDGLGDYQFTITTKNSESQQFFNQGLNLDVVGGFHFLKPGGPLSSAC